MDTSRTLQSLEELAISSVGDVLSSTPFPLMNITTIMETVIDNAAMQIWMTRVALALLCIILIVAAIGGNVVVICAILHTAYLRRLNNYLIVSLSFTDLGTAICCMPLFVMELLYNYRWPLSHALCALYAAIEISFRLLSVFTLAAISCERVFMITKPMVYQRLVTEMRMIGFIVVLWIVSFSYGFLQMAWFYVNEYREWAAINPNRCRYLPTCEFTVFAFAIAFILPLGIMSAAYIKIYCVVRGQIKRIRHRLPNNTTEDGLSDEFSTFHIEKPTLQHIQSISGITSVHCFRNFYDDKSTNEKFTDNAVKVAVCDDLGDIGIGKDAMDVIKYKDPNDNEEKSQCVSDKDAVLSNMCNNNLGMPDLESQKVINEELKNSSQEEMENLMLSKRRKSNNSGYSHLQFDSQTSAGGSCTECRRAGELQTGDANLKPPVHSKEAASAEQTSRTATCDTLTAANGTSHKPIVHTAGSDQIMIESPRENHQSSVTSGLAVPSTPPSDVVSQCNYAPEPTSQVLETGTLKGHDLQILLHLVKTDDEVPSQTKIIKTVRSACLIDAERVIVNHTVSTDNSSKSQNKPTAEVAMTYGVHIQKQTSHMEVLHDSETGDRCSQVARHSQNDDTSHQDSGEVHFLESQSRSTGDYCSTLMAFSTNHLPSNSMVQEPEQSRHITVQRKTSSCLGSNPQNYPDTHGCQEGGSQLKASGSMNRSNISSPQNDVHLESCYEDTRHGSSEHEKETLQQSTTKTELPLLDKLWYGKTESFQLHSVLKKPNSTKSIGNYQLQQKRNSVQFKLYDDTAHERVVANEQALQTVVVDDETTGSSEGNTTETSLSSTHLQKMSFQSERPCSADESSSPSNTPSHKPTLLWARRHFCIDHPSLVASTASMPALTGNDRRTLRSSRRRNRLFENKAICMTSYVIGLFLLCWVPYQICMMLRLFAPRLVPDILWNITTVIMFTSTAVNPFIYNFYSSQFRAATCKLLRCQPNVIHPE